MLVGLRSAGNKGLRNASILYLWLMTVFPSMEDPDGKLRRAKQHLEVFRDKVSAFKSLDSHTITVEDHPDTSEYVFKVEGLKPTDPGWGLVAGDCIHNMRTALDHLVFQLAILGQGGRELEDDEARSCWFPVYDDPRKLANPSKDGPIKFLRRGEQTRIVELQPFNAWDASIWGHPDREQWLRQDGEARIPIHLQRLVLLDNIDKHRTVHATWRVMAWWAAEKPPIPLLGYTGGGNPFENQAEVGRWHYGAPRPELPADMDMDRYFPIDVAFDKLPLAYSAIEVLDWLIDVVGIVLEIFRPCVEAGAAALPLPSISA